MITFNRECRALVTGGGSGLGKEICLELARRGTRLWIADLNQEAAASTASECLAQGATEAIVDHCDVRLSQAFDAMAKRITAKWGNLDFLVNNAGVAVAGPFEGHTLSDWQLALETNLWGVIYGCHAFFPMMKTAGKGSILNIASMAGLLNPPHMVAYNVSKAGVISMSESLQAECVGTSVRISVACPSFFRSGIFDNGRFVDARTRETARRHFDRTNADAKVVARRCLDGVESGKFYVLPMWDGRALWWLKRTSPAALSLFWSRVVRQKHPSRRLADETQPG